MYIVEEVSLFNPIFFVFRQIENNFLNIKKEKKTSKLLQQNAPHNLVEKRMWGRISASEAKRRRPFWSRC